MATNEPPSTSHPKVSHVLQGSTPPAEQGSAPAAAEDATFAVARRQSPRVCFVIMPSGNHKEYSHGVVESDFVFVNIIQPAVTEAFAGNVTVIREIDNRQPGSITRDIVSRTASCDLAIVDITGQNPNVFFELGIRYALRRKTTILLRQAGVVIPFDLYGFRCVDYSPFEHAAAVREVVKTIEAAQNSTSSDSLVYEVFPQLVVRGIPGVELDAEVEDTGRMPWTEYWRRLEDIARFIHDDRASRRYVPAIIVGISNGGMMFADLLARQFHGYVPVIGLWANRKSKNYFDSDINRHLLTGVRTTIKHGDELLLVDDIVASGTTVSQAVDFVHEHVPEASLSFLPMFNRNEQYLDAIRDVLLWLKPPFNEKREDARRVSVTNRTILPYHKDIRSA